ncbi:iron ABC transporter permease, partial [Synechocystis salina LEGE 00041]|nr:iron ABC transporter permease [Synechocystis salina LEGE 00041]
MFNFLTTSPASPKISLNIWVLVSLLIAAWIAVPVVFVFLGIFSWQGEIFSHLWETVLAEYIRNSLALMVG